MAAPPFKKTALSEALTAAAVPAAESVQLPASASLNKTDVPLRPELYTSFKMNLTAGFLLIFRYFGDRLGVDWDLLRVNYADGGNRVTLHFDVRRPGMTGRPTPEGLPLRANDICTSMVRVMRECPLKGLTVWGLGTMRGHYKVSVDGPEDALTLLQWTLDNAASQPLACLDHFTEHKGVHDAASTQDIISRTGSGDLWYLPGGLKASATAAFLQQHDSQDQQVLPFSLIELRSLLLQCHIRPNAPLGLPQELKDFIRH